MERLTEKRDGKNIVPLRQDGKTKWSLCSAGTGDASTQFLYGEHADKLAEYEGLEEQGKLLKLPCAVWDTVYRINKGAKEPIIPMKVCEVGAISLKVGGFVIQIMCRDESDNGETHYLSTDFGKTVFLTKSAAEQALKEMEGKK